MANTPLNVFYVCTICTHTATMFLTPDMGACVCRRAPCVLKTVSLSSSPNCFALFPDCFLTCLSAKTPRLRSVTFKRALNCVRPPWLQVCQGVVSVVAVRKVVDVEVLVPTELKHIPVTSKRPAEQTVNC